MVAFISAPVNPLLRPSQFCAAPVSSSTKKTSHGALRFTPIVRWTPGVRRSHLTHVRMSGSEPEEEETVSLADLQARLASAAKSPEATKTAVPTPTEAEAVVDPSDEERTEKQKEMDRLRAAEKFIEVDEGKFECTGCGFVYDPERGDGRSGIKVGIRFEDLPESYTCPQCRTPKRRFVSRKKVIAGFAENQTYGFGSNTMTGGQKSLLIFGGLALCFLLLLSGYAMN